MRRAFPSFPTFTVIILDEAVRRALLIRRHDYDDGSARFLASPQLGVQRASSASRIRVYVTAIHHGGRGNGVSAYCLSCLPPAAGSDAREITEKLSSKVQHLALRRVRSNCSIAHVPFTPNRRIYVAGGVESFEE